MYVSRTDRFNLIPSAKYYGAENVWRLFPVQFLEQYIQFLFSLNLIQHNEHPAAALHAMTLGSIHGASKETSKFYSPVLSSLHWVFYSNCRGGGDRCKSKQLNQLVIMNHGTRCGFFKVFSKNKEKIIWNYAILKIKQNNKKPSKPNFFSLLSFSLIFPWSFVHDYTVLSLSHSNLRKAVNRRVIMMTIALSLHCFSFHLYVAQLFN